YGLSVDSQSDLPGVDRRALADEIGIDTVTARLVQKDAAKLVANVHGHRTGWRWRRIEQADRALSGGASILRRRRVIEELEAPLHTGRLHGGLDLAVALGHRVNHQAHPGSGI